MAVSVWKVVDCVEVVLLHQCGVVSLWWGCCGMSWKSWYALWSRYIIVALLVDFRWSVKISCGMGILAWGTGWCCCRCVLAPPFWPSFWSIEYVNCTLLATPLQQAWLNCPLLISLLIYDLLSLMNSCVENDIKRTKIPWLNFTDSINLSHSSHELLMVSI